MPNMQLVVFPHYGATTKEIRNLVTDETLAIVYNDLALRLFMQGLVSQAKLTREQITVYDMGTKKITTIHPHPDKHESYGVSETKLYHEQEEAINKKLKGK